MKDRALRAYLALHKVFDRTSHWSEGQKRRGGQTVHTCAHNNYELEAGQAPSHLNVRRCELRATEQRNILTSRPCVVHRRCQDEFLRHELSHEFVFDHNS